MYGDAIFYHAKFGTKLAKQNRIGFLLDLTEKDLLKIYLLQNGRPLGLAFKQQAPFANEIYPMVQFKPNKVNFNSPAFVEIKEIEITNLIKLDDLKIRKLELNETRPFKPFDDFNLF